ncbi:MAG: HD domain-containing protein [Flavobacteriales bacterium]|nr:HD domain-containing protein [Flavobacteriales bacterium]
MPLEGERPQHGKLIHVPLNGDIHFAAHEIAIIDTPLFQRLREIKQVGLAYLVFPSLTHSRFEHSLGVVGRLDQLLAHLVRNTEQHSKPFALQEKIEKYTIPIRLAALLHDMGHCLFSHCSERVVNQLRGTPGSYPSSQEIRKAFSDHFRKNKLIPFAELFAVSILGTQRFLDFFKSLDFPRKSEKEAQLYLTQAAHFIFGLPMPDDPQTVFLSQLLSGGLDADKIDYMTREAHYAGINLGIDIDRILSKIEVFELGSHVLPRNLNYLKSSYGKDQKYWVLGFGKGGQYAFEEFCISRLVSFPCFRADHN